MVRAKSCSTILINGVETYPLQEVVPVTFKLKINKI